MAKKRKTRKKSKAKRYTEAQFKARQARYEKLNPTTPYAEKNKAQWSAYRWGDFHLQDMMLKGGYVPARTLSDCTDTVRNVAGLRVGQTGFCYAKDRAVGIRMAKSLVERNKRLARLAVNLKTPVANNVPVQQLVQQIVQEAAQQAAPAADEVRGVIPQLAEVQQG